MQHHDIAVVGAGLAGLLAAIALSDAGYRVALVGPAAAASDGRTTALMDPAIAFVKTLGLWPALLPSASALSSLRILDGTKRLLRAPAVTFHAAEIGLEAFGYNIPNAPFLALLETTVLDRPTLRRVTGAVAQMRVSDEGVSAVLDTGETLTADLVIGADGRRSAVRDAAEISARTWSYPQTAIVLAFAHRLPHHNISTEFHTEDGPFTQVPLPGNRSSLVWVCKPDAAQKVLALSIDALALAIEARMQSLLGSVSVEGVPQTFPLSGMVAHRFGKGRVVLIGEAAHAFPPIGAQGLNLSLRDVVGLLDILTQAGRLAIASDIGERYDRERRADILSRTASVDLLNRSLLSGFLPVQMLRASGLQILSSVAPLRNLMMREGVSPGSALRSLRENLREKIGGKGA